MNNIKTSKSIKTGDFHTNYHDIGDGEPIIFIHGSGPGASAYLNWMPHFKAFKQKFRIIALDLLGFGYTEKTQETEYNIDVWVKQVIDLMDALGLEKAHLVGNSLGGAIALALVIKHPERFNKIILLGALSTEFELTAGLDLIWGYTPSFENMKRLIQIIIYDKNCVNDELVKLRFEGSIRDNMQEIFAKMFPAPRQSLITKFSSPEADIKSIKNEVLIIHGKDDEVIPTKCSHKLHELISNSHLLIFSKCGHSAYIEYQKSFESLALSFLA